MRESNHSFPSLNRACVSISSSLYDRRAIDSPAPTLPLLTSLQHLAYLTSTSPRIREILTVDGGLERLISIVANCLDQAFPEQQQQQYQKGGSSSKSRTALSNGSTATTAITTTGTSGSNRAHLAVNPASSSTRSSSHGSSNSSNSNSSSKGKGKSTRSFQRDEEQHQYQQLVGSTVASERQLQVEGKKKKKALVPFKPFSAYTGYYDIPSTSTSTTSSRRDRKVFTTDVDMHASRHDDEQDDDEESRIIIGEDGISGSTIPRPLFEIDEQLLRLHRAAFFDSLRDYKDLPSIIHVYGFALQCLVNVGVRGSEIIRTRVIQAGVLNVVTRILSGFMKYRKLEREKRAKLMGEPSKSVTAWKERDGKEGKDRAEGSSASRRTLIPQSRSSASALAAGHQHHHHQQQQHTQRSHPQLEITAPTPLVAGMSPAPASFLVSRPPNALGGEEVRRYREVRGDHQGPQYLTYEDEQARQRRLEFEEALARQYEAALAAHLAMEDQQQQQEQEQRRQHTDVDARAQRQITTSPVPPQMQMQQMGFHVNHSSSAHPAVQQHQQQHRTPTPTFMPSQPPTLPPSAARLPGIIAPSSIRPHAHHHHQHAFLRQDHTLATGMITPTSISPSPSPSPTVDQVSFLSAVAGTGVSSMTTSTVPIAGSLAPRHQASLLHIQRTNTPDTLASIDDSDINADMNDGEDSTTSSGNENEGLLHIVQNSNNTIARSANSPLRVRHRLTQDPILRPSNSLVSVSRDNSLASTAASSAEDTEIEVDLEIPARPASVAATAASDNVVELFSGASSIASSSSAPSSRAVSRHRDALLVVDGGSTGVPPSSMIMQSEQTAIPTTNAAAVSTTTPGATPTVSARLIDANGLPKLVNGSLEFIATMVDGACSNISSAEEGTEHASTADEEDTDTAMDVDQDLTSTATSLPSSQDEHQHHQQLQQVDLVVTGRGRSRSHSRQDSSASMDHEELTPISRSLPLRHPSSTITPRQQTHQHQQQQHHLSSARHQSTTQQQQAAVSAGANRQVYSAHHAIAALNADFPRRSVAAAEVARTEGGRASPVPEGWRPFPSGTTAAAGTRNAQRGEEQRQAAVAPSHTATTPSFPPLKDHYLKEEDVLHCLHLLAYLSKYPHVRAVFHDPENEICKLPSASSTGADDASHAHRKHTVEEGGGDREDEEDDDEANMSGTGGDVQPSSSTSANVAGASTSTTRGEANTSNCCSCARKKQKCKESGERDACSTTVGISAPPSAAVSSTSSRNINKHAHSASLEAALPIASTSDSSSRLGMPSNAFDATTSALHRRQGSSSSQKHGHPSCEEENHHHHHHHPHHSSSGHAHECQQAQLEEARELATLPAKDRKPALEPLRPPRSTANNVFSLVEQYTYRPSSSVDRTMRMGSDIQYWAGVIMRNACRKDEAHGGVRQCANMGCGVWERFPREFAKCRRCRKAKYCSKGCQRKAWQAGHRYWCSARQDAPPAQPNNVGVGADNIAIQIANPTGGPDNLTVGEEDDAVATIVTGNANTLPGVDGMTLPNTAAGNLVTGVLDGITVGTTDDDVVGGQDDRTIRMGDTLDILA